MSGALRPLLDADEIVRYAEAGRMLVAVRQALGQAAAGAGHRRWFDAAPLAPAARSLLASMLGVGEITMAIAGAAPCRIVETAYQGVWMVEGDGQGGIEVGEMPGRALDALAACPAEIDLSSFSAAPAGTVSGLPLLAEIAHHLRSAGRDRHEINLSLLPMTPGDHHLLARALGAGPVEIECRGYGSCRIAGCGVRGVWRIHYFNSDGRMILDMLQVGGMPVAVQATPEDMAEAANELDGLIAAYFG